jgi:hypothetical protein
MMALKQEVSVKVVAKKAVASIFELVGFHKLMTLEVREGEQPGPSP